MMYFNTLKQIMNIILKMFYISFHSNIATCKHILKRTIWVQITSQSGVTVQNKNMDEND